jgi:hypothetical protein
MGILDSILGRSKQAKPDLDALFALPPAAVTLQVEAGFVPTGLGSVCYKAAEGAGFAQAQAEVQTLLDADAGPKVELTKDSYGYTWLLVRADPADLSGLVTDLHGVNSTLENAGFGPSLLCSLVPFQDEAGRRLAMVYLYKQGTWYPFAPVAGQKRDNTLELQAKSLVGGDLRIEPDLARWFPVWGAPGLEDPPASDPGGTTP